MSSKKDKPSIGKRLIPFSGTYRFLRGRAGGLRDGVKEMVSVLSPRKMHERGKAYRMERLASEGWNLPAAESDQARRYYRTAAIRARLFLPVGIGMWIALPVAILQMWPIIAWINLVGIGTALIAFGLRYAVAASQLLWRRVNVGRVRDLWERGEVWPAWTLDQAREQANSLPRDIWPGEVHEAGEAAFGEERSG